MTIVAKINKVVRIALSGGIIGLTTNPRRALRIGSRDRVYR